MLIRFFINYIALIFSFVILPQSAQSQDSIQIPFSNPKSFLINDLKSYKVSVSFSTVNSVNKYIAFYSLTKSTHLKNKISNLVNVGDSLCLNTKICFIGNDSIFEINGLRANNTYWIYVISVKDTSGYYVFSTLNALEIKVTTPSGDCNNYYDEIIPSAPNFIQVLSEKINPHNVISYSNYKNSLLEQYEKHDTLNGKKFVVCAYSGDIVVYDPPFDWNKLGLSREHTFAHSWMPSYPANSSAKPEYSDLHNLYVTNLEKANSVRSNHPFGEVTDSLIFSFKEGKLGYNGSKIVYEPRDLHKGNVARAIFYMSVAYNGIQSLSWKIPAYQDQEVLKKWHFEDLPDNYEIARHEFIYNIQGNRNPFIDSIQFACFIDFSKLLSNKNRCENLQIDELPFLKTSLIQCDNNWLFVDSKINNLSITDLTGKTVFTLDDNDVNQIDISSLTSGFYLLRFQIDGVPQSQMFMK